MSDLVTTMVPTGYIWHIWHEAEPLLKPAVDRSNGRYSINDVYRMILENTQQLWIVKDKKIDQTVAALVTQIIKYPGCSMLCIMFAGGTRAKEWVAEVIRMTDLFGKENTCRGLEIVGRFGWERMLKDLGMKKSFVTLEKEY